MYLYMVNKKIISDNLLKPDDLNKPDELLFYRGAKNSYIMNPKVPPNLDENFKLKVNGTYIDAYVDEQTKRVMITTRGTRPTDVSDVWADLKIGFNNLESSWRFKNDDDKVKKIIKLYPPNQHRYYISGHSLGGALVSALMRKYPFIRYGVAFNGATQARKDLPPNQNPKIKYIYVDEDFLYRFNRGYKHNPKTALKCKPEQTKSWFGWFKQRLDPTPTMLKAHSLAQPAFKEHYGEGKQNEHTEKKVHEIVGKIIQMKNNDVCTFKH